MKTKNLCKQLSCVVASLALMACHDTIEPDRAPEKNKEGAPCLVKTILFQADELCTRTSFGEKEDGSYPTLWTENDSAVRLALNFSEAGTAGIVPDDGYRTASFQADIDATGKEAPYTFYAVSPASAATALSPSREAWNISIPCTQTPLEGSVDEAAQILAAASAPSETLPDQVSIHFNHLTAYGRFSLRNLALGEARVEAVELTATTPFVGNWYWDCHEGHALTDNGASSTLTLRTSRTENLWFACAPVDMSGQIMVITVFTDQGAFVKEIEFPENRKFTAGRIAVFTVDMAGIEPSAGADEFRLVTSVSDLQAGDELLILNAAEKYALSTTQNSYNRPAEAITVTDHAVSEVPDNIQVVTLVSGTKANTWHLSTGNGYLANANGRNNRLLTVATKTDNATWTLSIASSGVATLTAGAGERKILRFNPNGQSPIFACYKEGQQDIVLYRKAAGAAGPVLTDPLTEESDYGCYLAAGTWRYTPGTDQFVRSYDAEGVQTFTLLGPDDLKQMEIRGYKKSYVKGDPVNLTVTWRAGVTKIVTGVEYKMTVVREEGPKVWLGDGSGHGFILKK